MKKGLSTFILILTLSLPSFCQTISIDRNSAIEVKKGLLQGEKLKEENKDLKSIIVVKDKTIAAQDGVMVAQSHIITKQDSLLSINQAALSTQKQKLTKRNNQLVGATLLLVLSAVAHVVF